jgi:hypothetical protein
MALHDELLQPLLHVPAEVTAIQQVDAAIHKPEAVGRADDGVARDVEDRATMYGYALEIATVTVPRIGERRLYGGQNNVRDKPPGTSIGSRFLGHKAHVLNPAKTSRRSGV